MNPLRRRLFLALGGLFLLKHWLFGEYGPFDRIVELAVLTAILYEIIAEVIRRRKEAAHRRLINQQTIALTQWLTKGERLQGGAPNTMTCNLQTAQNINGIWIAKVRAWITDTDAFISTNSQKASAEFMCLADAGHVSLYIGNAPHGYILKNETAEWYAKLTIHLENLRRILSTPEAYFEHGQSKHGSAKI